MTLIEERVAVLDTLKLGHGAHDPPDNGPVGCAMEIAGWLAGEEWSDHPACVSPVLGIFLRQWNDDLDDKGRQRLKPYLPRVIGTAGDGEDELRGWLCADWLVRTYTPAWLELAGVNESAAALRALAPLRDLASVKAARPAIDNARSRGAAAWDAARAAAWDAARAAAWDAARAAAGDAAWAAARDAARDAAWDAAWDAARDAAWDAAWDAARDAAWAAGRKAANASLASTKVALQESALDLLDAMIDPSDGAD